MKTKDYIKKNQKAWEEAYDRSTTHYQDIVSRLEKDATIFIPERVKTHLNPDLLKGKDIAQLACNNGREILSLGMTYQAKSMTGFDLADNMVKAAQSSADQLGVNARFYQRNIVEIEKTFHQSFDFVFILIGVLCWMDDIDSLIGVVKRILKPQGSLIILDGHPTMHMMGFEEDEGYDENNPHRLMHSYFRKTPFVEYGGMGYLTDQPYQSKAPFTSFLYTFEDIFKALINHQLSLVAFSEGEEDELGNFPDLAHQGFPLVFYLEARKD